MSKKKETAIDQIAKDLKLNKNQVAALTEYNNIYGNVESLCHGKSIYQIGNNLRSKTLIRLFFKEV